MDNLRTRIDTLATVFDRWLSDENEHMLLAVHETVEEGYFTFSDVQFALKALRSTLHKKALERWVARSGISDQQDARAQNVLCLHAGNLPLVGFQDALATLLSGARYSGKISRKDPYLLPTFLNEVKKTETWSGIDVQWTHRLDDFEGMRHDAILFAGSARSVPGVERAIQQYELAKPSAQKLIRSAHFSMAYIDDSEEDTLNMLTQAILRYGGMGCRSAGVVVAPFPLEEVREVLGAQAEAFWKENPPHTSAPPRVKQLYAYNEAVGRDQLWLGNFLYQSSYQNLGEDFVCHWIVGDARKANELAMRCGNELQSVYTCSGSGATFSEAERTEEPLAEAQQPPIDWKPDGTDSLKWLANRSHV